MQNQITLFQRFKNYINSLSVGATYTTDDLYWEVGQYEFDTMWKRWNKQRMYRTSTYQTYLKRLGALEKVKRGTWKVLHHIPEWFYSKHMNYLLGYSNKAYAEHRSALESVGCPESIIDNIFIPAKERINPFKSEPKQEKAVQVTIDVDFLKELYQNANREQKGQLKAKYPKVFETPFDFGSEYTLGTINYGRGPLMIAKGLAPAGMVNKCLVVTHGYELRTMVENGSTFIYFVEK